MAIVVTDFILFYNLKAVFVRNPGHLFTLRQNVTGCVSGLQRQSPQQAAPLLASCRVNQVEIKRGPQ